MQDVISRTGVDRRTRLKGGHQKPLYYQLESDFDFFRSGALQLT